MKDLKIGKDDDSVAEIIGAILLFGIAITLVTAYLAWYVPVSQTNNEAVYSTNAYSSISSLGSMISSVDNSNPVVWNAELGIAETFPIVPAADTSVIATNSSIFSFHLSFVLNVTLQNATGNLQYMNISEKLSDSGYVSMEANLQYIQGNSVILADGMVIQLYRTLPPSMAGEVPISVSGNAGLMNLSTHIYGIESPGVYASSTTPVTITFNPHNLSEMGLTVGTLTSLNGNITEIRNIQLSNLNYTLSSPYKDSMDLFLYRDYNGSLLNSTDILSLAKWNLSGDDFQVSIHGNSLSILQATPHLGLHSLDVSTFLLRSHIS